MQRKLAAGAAPGYSPAEIAKRQVIAVRTVEVALSQGLYRYVEHLTGRDRNSLDSWRDVATWLETAGYRTPRSPSTGIRCPMSQPYMVVR